MPLESLLQRALTRIRLRDALAALAWGTGSAGVLILIARMLGMRGGVSVAMGTFAAIAVTLTLFLRSRTSRTAAGAAAAIERHDGSLRNLLVTAEQLLQRPGTTSASMRERVMADASRRSSAIDVARAIPIARPAGALLAATVLVVIAFTVRPSARPAVPNAASIKGASKTVTPSVVIDIVPPAYTGRPASRVTDPRSVEALAGSRATLRTTGIAHPDVRVNAEPLTVSEGAASFEFVESGYIAVQADGVNRLIPLTVVPDRVPDVRITAPAKDLRVATAAAAIPIAAQAADDMALQSLEIRYTVVSGTGEQFSFTEGTLPASVTRTSDRSWSLAASLSLRTLKLEPGDALIYRAVAADRRPGDAGAASSDTFFVEVAGPGDVPLEGVEMPPDKERYALSQAMIVLKIERLQAREASMARGALADAAGNIAAEQRAVRANFVFLLGGEVEDEEAEAEASHEISEGRFANQARREIVNATVLMGRVEKALAVPSTREALPLAREAVKALQRAFGHSRYLLRALPSRARIDPARRLSGDVSSARDWTRALAPLTPDPSAEAARSALADVVRASAAMDDGSQRSAAVGALTAAAERMLAAGPDLQSAARDVIAARDAVAQGRIDVARAALSRAAGPLIVVARRGGVDGSSTNRAAQRLSGAAAIAGGGPGR